MLFPDREGHSSALPHVWLCILIIRSTAKIFPPDPTLGLIVLPYFITCGVMCLSITKTKSLR